ncbi:MAG TPA: hypothetical protein VF189_06180 [Patescibacteria group bacterium]
MSKDRLVYAATPSRNKEQTQEIMEFISGKDFFPVHPFPTFPYEFYEGNPRLEKNNARELALRACFRAIKMCDEVWIFGISDGTLREARYALNLNRNPIRKIFQKTKKIRLHLEFDEEWKRYAHELTPQHSKTLRRLGLFK